jgi:hypothetical protein
MCATGCGGCNDCGGVELPDGPAGIDGKNSFTVTTGAFNVPAIGADRTINVSALGQATGTWAVAGQTIFIEGAGYYEVVSSTHTTITATNLGTTGNAAPSALIALGKGVSPAGAPGVDGVDGTTLLHISYPTTPVNSTLFTAIGPAVNLPANTFLTAGDMIRVSLIIVGDSPHPIQPDYWIYDVKITIGGIDLVLPATNPLLRSTSWVNLNGVSAEVNIIALSVGATPVFISDISHFQVGLGLYTPTDGYAVQGTLMLPIPPMHVGNAFSSGYTTGVGATTAIIPFQVFARRTAVGSPTATPNIYLPMLKIELIKR